MRNIVIVGAGIGGLTTAALLAQKGFPVTVLEAHVYPGGSAGTFFHQGYRFDAGATLAGGFYENGPMDKLAKSLNLELFPKSLLDPAMVVHLPDQKFMRRYSGERRWDERFRVFGRESLRFWGWQEKTADLMWDFALRLPDWPPQTPTQYYNLFSHGISWVKSIKPLHQLSTFPLDFFRTTEVYLEGLPEEFKYFIDAQLLISAQTTSKHANALYAASALDLPRRGVAVFEGGMGEISRRLVKFIRTLGGQVFFRKVATRLVFENGLPTAIEINRKDSIPTDAVILNLTPWNVKQLVQDLEIPKIRKLPDQPDKGWGAFMVYLGVDEKLIPSEFPLHHQILSDSGLCEGGSIFLSISPSWDMGRAPVGKRAITISTHTKLEPWWEMYQNNPDNYHSRKQQYVENVLNLAEKILPGIKDSVDLILPGTPVTFKRFTRRAYGWVGGFPQTNNFQVWAPKLSNRLWLVGDSIFPGQSIAAVMLGGMRVANDVCQAMIGEPVVSFDRDY